MPGSGPLRFLSRIPGLGEWTYEHPPEELLRLRKELVKRARPILTPYQREIDRQLYYDYDLGKDPVAWYAGAKLGVDAGEIPSNVISPLLKIYMEQSRIPPSLFRRTERFWDLPIGAADWMADPADVVSDRQMKGIMSIGDAMRFPLKGALGPQLKEISPLEQMRILQTMIPREKVSEGVKRLIERGGKIRTGELGEFELGDLWDLMKDRHD